jgi:hypothetical protein
MWEATQSEEAKRVGRLGLTSLDGQYQGLGGSKEGDHTPHIALAVPPGD